MGSHSNNHNNDDYYGGLSPETFSPVLFSREKNIFCRLEIKSMAAKRKTFPDWNRNGENLGWGLRPSFIFSRLSRRVLIVTHPVFNQFLFLFLKSLPRFFVPLGRCNLNWPIRRFHTLVGRRFDFVLPVECLESPPPGENRCGSRSGSVVSLSPHTLFLLYVVHTSSSVCVCVCWMAKFSVLYILIH